MPSDAGDNVSASSPQVQGVHATAGGLLKATLGAAAVAAGILTFIWLPAEYGIDPTGVGHSLGLTQMGQIKEQLHTESDADAAAAQTINNGVSDITALALTAKLDAIQAQLSVITAAVSAKSVASPAQRPVEPESSPATTLAVSVSRWVDEVSYTLVPGEGIEIKLVMDEGAVADYEWSANGAVVNHDTHGDGSGKKINYEKGRAVPEQAGQLIAAFNGNHGWFWRNRTEDNVVVTLRTKGNYTKMILP